MAWSLATYLNIYDYFLLVEIDQKLQILGGKYETKFHSFSPFNSGQFVQ